MPRKHRQHGLENASSNPGRGVGQSSCRLSHPNVVGGFDGFVDEMTSILEKQRQFFRTGRTLDLGFRQDQLRRLGAEIVREEKAILEALRLDLGKPPLEAYLGEVYFTCQEIDCAIGNLRNWSRPERVFGGMLTLPSRCEIRPEPYGVALILGPWNYPFQLLLVPLVSALAAGNCAVLKTSEHAPATSRLVAQLVEACFPPEYVTVVEAGTDAAKALVALPFDYCFYTGSTNIGREVMTACARNLVPVTLELGGKCPCIVDRDTRLDHAIKRIVRGKFFNAGQTCVAPDYVCVHESQYAQFVDQVLATVRQFYGEDPQQSPDYARIIHERHFGRLLKLTERAGDVRSVGTHDRPNRFFAPTLICNPDGQAPVMEEEIFGPILPCVSYRDLDELLTTISRRPKPLALYVFSGNRDFQERCLNAVPSGGACVNDTLMHITPQSLPFGGVGASGMGRYHGKFGFNTFSHSRSVMRKSSWLDPFAVFPPYGETLKRLKPILKSRF